jgi:hypothetical protein
VEGSRSSDWIKRHRKSVPSGPCHLRAGDRGDTIYSRLPWKGSLRSILLQPASDGVIVTLQEKFKGEIVHSSKFKNAKGNAGKRVLVIGAGISAHDIASDHVNHGAGKHPVN